MITAAVASRLPPSAGMAREMSHPVSPWVTVSIRTLAYIIFRGSRILRISSSGRIFFSRRTARIVLPVWYAS